MMHLTATPSREVAQMLASATSKWRLNRKAWDALLRVRTRPECPDDNLRELMWDSNPNCGIARERGEKKERERESFPAKSPNLRHCRPTHRTKDWENTRGELASCRPAHPPLEAGGRQPEPERGKLGPREGIPYQTVSRLPVANQDFLGFWTVDILQEGRSQRLAPQKRHMAYLRWHTSCHPVNQVAGTGKVIRRTTSKESALAKHLVTWPAWTWEGHNMQAQPSLRLCGVPKILNLRGLDLRSACNPGPALDSSLAEPPGAWAVQTGKAHTPWAGANPVWPRHCEHSPHKPVIFVCSVPPSPQHDWTSEPK